MTSDDVSGNCITASEDITISLGVNISAAPVTNTICAGNDLMVPGNPSGGTGNYVGHAWSIESGIGGINPTNGFSTTYSRLGTGSNTISEVKR